MEGKINRDDLNERITTVIYCPNEQQFAEKRNNFIN